MTVKVTPREAEKVYQYPNKTAVAGGSVKDVRYLHQEHLLRESVLRASRLNRG